MSTERPELSQRLATLLSTHAPEATRALLHATVRLLYRERAAGHVCIALDEWANLANEESAFTFPPLEEWRAALLATNVCSGAPVDPLTPLVLDTESRLYLRRDHHNEHRILKGITSRLSTLPSDGAHDSAIAEALEQLEMVPATADDGTGCDWQLAAVLAASLNRFLLLTGGPGTGKTTTIVRLLQLLLYLDPTIRIALAAPTGKAAARMGEALAQSAAKNPQLADAMATLQPCTLHRLLGYLPFDDSFRAGPDRQLPFDVVIVDEASMLDPAVLAVLFGALRPDARLVLVGDRDQLAAVAAGQVLGDLCRAAKPDAGVGERLGSFVGELTGMAVPIQSNAAPIANAVVTLRVNHRFGAQPGLDHFAQALARRDAKAALAAIDAGHPDLENRSDPESVLTTIQDALSNIIAAEPATALEQLGSVRILAASRHGTLGTEAWNRRVEAFLQEHGTDTDDPWYQGRPILITSNDPQNRLWNGDVGIACRDTNGRPQVAFADARTGIRTVSAFRIPAHETAWAMTVHKAQGSEFDTVILSMPETDGPLWQAPLIYTGITRARRRAILLANREMLTIALGRWPLRSSGLAAGLAIGLTTGLAPG